MRLDTTRVDTVWNSQSLRKIRKQFLSGEKPNICKKCWVEESHGSVSMRQQENARYLHEYKQRIIEARENDGQLKSGPVSLDIRLGSICNLACKSCFPTTSTAWAPQYKDLLKDDGYFKALYSLDNFQSSLYWEKNVDISSILDRAESVREIYLAGGEPLLMPKSRELIAGLVNRGSSSHIHLRFHTNLTHWSDTDFSLLSQFKKVSVQVSIDSVGEANNWIRFPSQWETIESHLRKVICLPNAIIKVAPTLSVYSILKIDSLYNWYSEFKSIHKIPMNLDFSHVYEPTFLSLKNLPSSLKPAVIKKMEHIISVERNSKVAVELLGAISMLRQDCDIKENRRLKEFTLRLDKKTPGKFKEIFPELFDCFNTVITSENSQNRCL